MKRIGLVLLIALGLNNTAAADSYQPFKTIEAALKYCPATDTIRFIANNKSIPESAGTARTYKNNHLFESIPTGSALLPKSLSLDDVILDAKFRQTEGMYAYISNNIVTCLYNYEGFTGVNVALTLRQK